MQNPYTFSLGTPPSNLDPSSWCVVDVETGGLDPTKNSLLQIAFFQPDVGCNSFLVRDSAGLSERSALEVNGLSIDEVREHGIDLESARRRFLKWTAGRAIVGQNIAFDLGFIASRLFELPPGSPACQLLGRCGIYDTLKIFRRLHDEHEVPRARLIDIATHYGFECDPAQCHDAGYDALLTALVFKRELEELDVFRTSEK